MLTIIKYITFKNIFNLYLYSKHYYILMLDIIQTEIEKFASDVKILNNSNRYTKLIEFVYTMINKYDDGKIQTINTIIFIVYEYFNVNLLNLSKYDFYSKKLNKMKLLEKRLGQHKFRSDVIERDKVCLITGDPSDVCEACHIIPYSLTKSNNVSNGLLFNNCFHKLFDTYKFSINQNKQIVFSQEIINSNTYKNYHSYDGAFIENISLDSMEYLNTHWKTFVNLNKSVF